MWFLEDLLSYLRAERPELRADVLAGGETMLIREEPAATENESGGDDEADDGMPSGAERPIFVVEQHGDAVLLDGLWRVPLAKGFDEVRRFVIEYIDEAIENHGWEVPVILVGGPRHGLRLSKAREDLVGRLMLARKNGGDGTNEAHLYKWHLKKNARGEYVCVYERSLRGEEVDDFLARGVHETGPFVLIHDKSQPRSRS